AFCRRLLRLLLGCPTHAADARSIILATTTSNGVVTVATASQGQLAATKKAADPSAEAGIHQPSSGLDRRAVRAPRPPRATEPAARRERTRGSRRMQFREAARASGHLAPEHRGRRPGARPRACRTLYRPAVREVRRALLRTRSAATRRAPRNGPRAKPRSRGSAGVDPARAKAMSR